MKIEAPDGTYDAHGDPPLAVDFMFDFFEDTPEIKQMLKESATKDHNVNKMTSEMQYRAKFRSLDKDFHQCLAARIACVVIEQRDILA